MPGLIERPCHPRDSPYNPSRSRVALELIGRVSLLGRTAKKAHRGAHHWIIWALRIRWWLTNKRGRDEQHLLSEGYSPMGYRRPKASVADDQRGDLVQGQHIHIVRVIEFVLEDKSGADAQEEQSEQSERLLVDKEVVLFLEKVRRSTCLNHRFELCADRSRKIHNPGTRRDQGRLSPLFGRPMRFDHVMT